MVPQKKNIAKISTWPFMQEPDACATQFCMSGCFKVMEGATATYLSLAPEFPEENKQASKMLLQ